MAAIAIGMAHELLLHVFQVQLDHFPVLKERLERSLDEAGETFKRIWDKPPEDQTPRT